MTINTKDIKAKMEELFIAWTEREDDSYLELYQTFKRLRACNLISDKDWKMIYDYDRDLFYRIG